MQRKIVTVLGARPQIIKASVVSHALDAADALKEVLVHTGQHFDVNMSNVFFEELGMRPPAYNLGIHGGLHGAMTGHMLTEVERVLMLERPDAVLVYGDTNSTLAGALAAAKLHIPVAHVEAGLRSFNMHMPEEINRVLTDRISRWLFTPTDAAAVNLRREGFTEESIATVGDVMYDVALHQAERASKISSLMDSLGVVAGKYVLVTIHRSENTDDRDRLVAIVRGLAAVAQHCPIVWPMHPRTRRKLTEYNVSMVDVPNVLVVEPVGYLEMIQLERSAALIATDSGGVQKEAFFHKVPCVTLRDETEWVELVDAGWNHLASPASAEGVASAIRQRLGTTGIAASPYGEGVAAKLIVRHLTRALEAE